MKDNKLIAEFMGYHYVAETTSTHDYFMVKGRYIRPYGIIFDTDWNWLMKVVEKIENFGFEFFIVESRCKIAHNTDHSIETIVDFEIIGTKIQATYKAVVEFIKWYNNGRV